MASCPLILLFLSIIAYSVYGGKIRPYGPTPILLNTSNAGEYAEYNFTMTLDTTIESNGIILITFPLQQYNLGLGLIDNFVVYAPYPTTIACTLVTNIALTEVYKQLNCPVGRRLANQSFTISMIGIRNPLKVGGTGMFRLESIYGVTGKVLDYNYAFGVIGLAPAAVELFNASIAVESGYSGLAGEISNWIFSFTPVDNLQANIDIRIVFAPELFNFGYAQTYQCEAVTDSGFALSGPIACKFNTDFPNMITIVGNNATIPKGSDVKLRLLNFFNPTRECTTEFITIYVLEQNTNNTIQYLAGVPGLIISRGTIYDVEMSVTYSGFQLYSSSTRQFILNFRPSNPFNSVRIATAFPLITSCSVIYGLALKDFNTPISCTSISNVMTIMGFATYAPENLYMKVIQILFTANLPSIAQTLNPVFIYTYFDTVFLFPVDQNVTAYNTRQIILSGPASVLTKATMVSTVTTPGGTGGIITFTIEASSTLAATNVVEIQIGDIFYGIPICQYKPHLGVFASVTCSSSSGIITVNLGTLTIISSGGSALNEIRVTGLTNPYAVTAYPFRINVYAASSSTPTHYRTGTFDITAVSITAASAALLARRQSRLTPLLVSFTTPVALYDGYQLAEEPYKEASEININIYMTDLTNNWFYYDLGYSLNTPAFTLQDQSSIPCQAIAGFSASTFTSTVSCDILLGPTSSVTTASYVTVRVRDFTGVLSNTAMKIAIPIFNQLAPGVPSTPKMDIIIYYRNSNKKYLIASTTINPTNTIVTGGVPVTLTLTAALASSNVQATSDLTLTFNSPAITSTGDNSIVVFYPKGFTFSSTTIMELDGTTVAASRIVYYNTLLFFTVLIPANLAAASHTLLITDVNTPSSVITANTISLGLTSSYDYVGLTSTTITLTPGTFDQTTGNIPFMDVRDAAPSHPYATYIFEFTTTLAVTSLDRIVVTFPAGLYNFALLSPPPYSAKYKNLADKSKDSPVTGTCAASSCTVSSFSDIPLGTRVGFTVYNVLNPAGSISGQSFVVTTQDSLGNLIETSNIVGNATMVAGATFTTLNLNVTEPKLIPNNAIVFGIASFFLNPGFDLPKYATITIDFPSGFVLYHNTLSDTECVAEGGLYSIIDCVTPAPPGLNIVMQTGERSDGTIPITLYYVGYAKMDTPGTLVTGFGITVTYQGVTIASNQNPIGTYTIGPALMGSMIMTVDIDFYPQNEGEQANYYFTFNTLMTSLTPDMTFFIRFPADYDPQLCLYNLSVESTDLQGALHWVLVMRDLRITGFNATTVTGPITIRVWGVVNPNRYDNTVTGYFQAGIIKNTEFLEGNDQIFGIIPLLAPESISLTSLSSAIQYSRYRSSFVFKFKPAQTILASELGGLVYIDFPPDFIIDFYGGNCTIDRDFSFFVSCKVDNNRITINASNNEWTTSHGTLTLTIYDVNNPDNDAGTIGFVIANYDSFNKRLLGRTYSTLNPASLYFEYDGDQISVNDDQPIFVEVGTYTDRIYITIKNPSVQSLTLTPNVLSPDILFDIFPMKIGLGTTTLAFRVAAPRYILLKTFYIQWSKTGDSYNPSYCPIRRTQLKMVSKYYIRTVQFEGIEYIPQGGISYPLAIFTNNPPYNGLSATLTVVGADPLVWFDTTDLFFAQGQSMTFHSVTIDTTHALTPVQIRFALSGFDSASYTLPVTFPGAFIQDTLTIPVNPPEPLAPSLLSFTCTSTSRVSARFNLQGMTLSFIYFAYGNLGMPWPVFKNVQNQTANSTLSYSNYVYDVTYIKRVSRSVDFSILDLKPGINYTVYFYVMNLNRIFQPQWYQVNFTTIKPDKPASFIMMILQNNVSSDLKREWFVRMSSMISIEKERVIELMTDCIQTQLALSYSAPNTSFVQVCILPDLENTNLANSPFNLIENLNLRVAEIQTFVPRLAGGDLLQRQNLPEDLPFWVGTPIKVSADTGSITVSAKVDRCGYIYAIALPVALSRNRSASNLTVIKSRTTDVYVTSFQIFSELNYTNLPAINTSIRVDDITQTYELNLSGMADKLIYQIFLTTENDWPKYSNWPVYNQLLTDTSVQRVELKTLKIRKPLNIYSQNKGIWLSVMAIPQVIVLIVILLYNF